MDQAARTTRGAGSLQQAISKSKVTMKSRGSQAQKLSTSPGPRPKPQAAANRSQVRVDPILDLALGALAKASTNTARLKNTIKIATAESANNH
jgi:hypothetical protein